ncbi:MAG: TauD/TfdA family dioxygenase [Burkholderiaceae bacterium]|nr:TauD/TfdA family dioxygenase [Burkholderiaceae bacterium]MCD8564520.1 TauD/TfdA family dioxygenase [Burkholderiaceae bacterium]
MKVVPLTGSIGAEILDIDISSELAESVIADIRDVLLKHKVVFFREQNLTPERQIAFAKRFGDISTSPVYTTLKEHPEIMPVVKEATDRDIIGDTWHTDETFQQTPPMGSLLYARQIPSVGGDTLWANLGLAFDRLSDGMKERLMTMKAIHSNDFLTANAKARNSTRSTKLREDAPVMHSLHPVVRTHDETNEKVLFVNQPFTYAFEGMTREESLPLLSFLYQASSRPELTCRFRWRKGSLAFWDNRCTLHYACNDYSGERREMHRITIEGSVPR